MLSNVDFDNALTNYFVTQPQCSDALRPASIDLSVGKIFVPPEKDSDPATEETSHIVQVGGTLVIETYEELRIPSTHAGIMFPKSSALAEKGILITNFGCVDPGYEGHLKFVIVNLGRKPFEIRSADKIVTLLLFQLSSEASPDFQEYSKNRPPGLTTGETGRLLSRDFVKVRERARKEAKKTVQNSVVGIGIVLALFLVIPAALISLAPPLIESQLSYGKTDKRFDEIEQLMKDTQSELRAEISTLSKQLSEASKK